MVEVMAKGKSNDSAVLTLAGSLFHHSVARTDIT